MGPGCGVDLPYGGSLTFDLDSIFADIAVGTDSDVKLGAIRTGKQGLGPVVVDRPAWQVGQFGSLSRDGGLSILIRVADDGIGVRHIEIVANQRDAKRRVQVVQKYSPQRRNA